MSVIIGVFKTYAAVKKDVYQYKTDGKVCAKGLYTFRMLIINLLGFGYEKTSMKLNYYE